MVTAPFVSTSKSSDKGFAVLEFLGLVLLLEVAGVFGFYDRLNVWTPRWNVAGKVLWLVIPLVLISIRGRSFHVYGITNLGLSRWRGDVLLPAALFGAPFLVATIAGWIRVDPVLGGLWFSTLTFQALNAWSEEVLWRGYLQTRLNEAFGRPWVLCGISWGPGLLVVAVFFGLVHVLNPFHPLHGGYTPAWTWGLVTLNTGLFLGFLREKTGSIHPPAFLHLWINLFSFFVVYSSKGSEWLWKSLGYTLMWPVFLTLAALHVEKSLQDDRDNRDKGIGKQ